MRISDWSSDVCSSDLIHTPIKYTLHETPAREGEFAIRYTSSEPTDDPRWGLLSAIDLSNGKISWQQKTEQPLVGGVLATAGGLLFTGEGNGNFNAYEATSGKLLWQARADAGGNARSEEHTSELQS